MDFLRWSDYILRFFSRATSANPLRIEPFDNAKVVEDLDYAEVNFRNVEVSGDWVKVVCNRDCEGCSDNGGISGWLRWRKRW